MSSTGYDQDTPTGWVGWILYAGVMMILLGAFQAMEGLVALFDHRYYHVVPHDLVVRLNYTGYGWIHLILGLVAVFGGYALMSGRTWARVYAVVLAMVSAITNLSFLSAYPIWAVMIITIDALIIWAVCVHGNEMRSVSG